MLLDVTVVTIIVNIVLVLGGFLSASIASRQARDAKRSADSAEEQAEAAKAQAKIAEEALKTSQAQLIEARRAADVMEAQLAMAVEDRKVERQTQQSDSGSRPNIQVRVKMLYLRGVTVGSFIAIRNLGLDVVQIAEVRLAGSPINYLDFGYGGEPIKPELSLDRGESGMILMMVGQQYPFNGIRLNPFDDERDVMVLFRNQDDGRKYELHLMVRAPESGLLEVGQIKTVEV